MVNKKDFTSLFVLQQKINIACECVSVQLKIALFLYSKDFILVKIQINILKIESAKCLIFVPLITISF